MMIVLNNKDNQFNFLSEANLINHGYKKKEDRYAYERIDKDKNNFIKYLIDFESNTFKIIYKKNNEYIQYIYYYINNYYEYKKYLYDKLDVQYIYKNDNLLCEHGNCIDYKKYNNYIKNEFFKLSNFEN